MSTPDKNDELNAAEAERRFKDTLHKMLNTPHQPHETAAGKKRTAKRAKSLKSAPLKRGGK